MTEAGVAVVDKPAGWTSHDVVARCRRLAGTRRVGHAGTLDPMATGVLLVGVERATKLLGHLALADKAYSATIRLGQTTVTDDAEGDVLARRSAVDITPDQVRAGVAALTGALEQVPSAVSAIKVGGQRSYARVRAGEDVRLAPRRVVVSRFDVVAVRPAGDLVDVDVLVECSTGTYVRALARDLGAALGVGGHLTALRRTRVGPFTLDEASSLERLERAWAATPLAQVARRCFPARELSEDEARVVSHGGPIDARGESGTTCVFEPAGAVVALMEPRAGMLRSVVVLAPA